MEVIDLNNICELFKINKIQEKPIMIKNIVKNIAEIDNDTLVFHLNKTIELDEKKFALLHHCYIVTDQPVLTNISHLQKQFLFVLDVQQYYEKFINYYRELFPITTVAVTGTCGKTTTKEMIKQILSKKYRVTGTILSKNSLSFNHDYLMKIDKSIQYGIYETGLTDPGNIIHSCHYFKPSIGVITNIGIDHLSGCKSLDNYIRAKGEMLAGLQYKGTLVINGDDEAIKKIDFTPYKGKIITFGIKNDADFFATNIRNENLGMKFSLIFQKHKYEAYVPGFGEHNVYNALAALAVLKVLGFDLQEAIYHLVSFKHIHSHLEFHKGINNSTIVDDTWSSNPTSMKAAFAVFNEKYRTKIAVLGNISYLGDYALEQCKYIGKMVVDYKVDYLITKDAFSKQIGKEAVNYGMDKSHIFYCNNEVEMNRTLNNLIKPQTIVLFKISMFDKSMQNIIKSLISKRDEKFI